MRDFKFRAWDKKHRWVAAIVCLNMWPWRDVILIDPRDGISTYSQLTKNVNLMQYTGLKDENGKDIYEGDIIKIYRGVGYSTKRYPSFKDGTESIRTHVVEYEEENARYPRLNREGECDLFSVFEIIGNIYENPELLEKK